MVEPTSPVLLRSPTGRPTQFDYTVEEHVGEGQFASVFKCISKSTYEVVAIKRIRIDERYKTRELEICQALYHPNIVELKRAFHEVDKDTSEKHLHLVMEYIPKTVADCISVYRKKGKQIPLLTLKLYSYQIFRGLAYLNKRGVCHRDIKPQNLLIDTSTHMLKICDFGSAKVLSVDEANVAYVCARYYRAPELIFGSIQYSTAIDMWAAGCVVAEMALGRVLFPGNTTPEQLIEVMKVLGTPTRADIREMNPNYTQYRFPHLKVVPLIELLPGEVGEFLQSILVYSPAKRLTAEEALTHKFFDELKDPNTRLPPRLPNLFDDDILVTGLILPMQ